MIKETLEIKKRNAKMIMFYLFIFIDFHILISQSRNVQYEL